ncbi:ornithine aminotransferase, variant 2 [Balamuthia mandrillaris]
MQQHEPPPQQEEQVQPQQHPWVKYVNPVLGHLMGCIALDKRFTKAEGSYLYDHKGERYLDMLANYGAVPFGYNPPQLWAVMEELRLSQEPIFSIPSLLDAAGELAQRLLELQQQPTLSVEDPSAPVSDGGSNSPSGGTEMQRQQLRYVTFANSGSEAMEWAIKLARARTRRLRVLSTYGAYHGKTLGALSATGRPQYQSVFGAPVQGFEFIPYGDIKALQDKLQHSTTKEESGLGGTGNDQYCAFVIEPIQGEGGIIVPPKGFLKAARELCSKHGILLVFDEIQTGLGRTGDMFAFEHEDGAWPDILCLSKALGGGMQPIGAMLCTEDASSQYFFYQHSSTFAGGAMACRTAVRTIDMLTANDRAVIKHVKETGDYLISSLHRLVAKHKAEQYLVDVRGRGFMIGLQFTGERTVFEHSTKPPELETYVTCLLGAMAEQGLLAVLISSYILNVHHIRLTNALNFTNTIRIEPALNISKEMCDQLLVAVEDVLQLLTTHSTAALVGFLLGAVRELPSPINRKRNHPTPKLQETPNESQSSIKKLACIVCALTPATYISLDENLSLLTEAELEDLSQRLGELMEPWILYPKNLGEGLNTFL